MSLFPRGDHPPAEPARFEGAPLRRPRVAAQTRQLVAPGPEIGPSGSPIGPSCRRRSPVSAGLRADCLRTARQSSARSGPVVSVHSGFRRSSPRLVAGASARSTTPAPNRPATNPVGTWRSTTGVGVVDGLALGAVDGGGVGEFDMLSDVRRRSLPSRVATRSRVSATISAPSAPEAERPTSLTSSRIPSMTLGSSGSTCSAATTPTSDLLTPVVRRSVPSTGTARPPHVLRPHASPSQSTGRRLRSRPESASDKPIRPTT